MRSKLPPSLSGALEIHAQLNGPVLQQCVLELIEFFNTEFEMVFPPLNYPLLIYKHIRDLGLPGKYCLLSMYTPRPNTRSRDIPRCPSTGINSRV
jgi:hypothetical protein